ncbi:hypothetical protein QVD17_25785 [Tagetes erecta]|uniref:Uncharacterized protein n=1 Tax=Tagetes erecta TaxID=13708 RepID=A0AAD8NHZ8_TARER|nr:hypothetical protein QVD17_25785 [Tagetes erecta]
MAMPLVSEIQQSHELNPLAASVRQCVKAKKSNLELVQRWTGCIFLHANSFKDLMDTYANLLGDVFYKRTHILTILQKE